MKIINNKCSNCGYDGAGGWLISNPVKCPNCGQRNDGMIDSDDMDDTGEEERLT